jgi:beta-mannosidase
VELSGRWVASPVDDELRRGGVALELDDSAWTVIAVPSHWRSHPAFAASDGPLLYRHRFEHPGPEDGERLFVTLDGVFYQADVWLDGAYLGDPEGYFFAHSFDVTDLMRIGREHVLAIEATCFPQHNLNAKRNITGSFQHSPSIDPSWNPGGLWRPVRLTTTGPVRIERCRVLCRDANDARAHLRLAARLDSDAPRVVRIRTFVDGVMLARQRHSLASGMNEVAWNIDVNEPRLWWPWSMGEQPLTDITVEVSVEGKPSDRHTVRTGLREVAFQDWTFSVNGERLFIKGANVGPTRRELGEASPDELRRDVELAREAGLDLIRVHSHVSRPELYDAADELGMLVWQDFPLHGGYARTLRRQAVHQARAAVDALGHHPSIVMWCAHDDPSKGRRDSILGQQLPSWNRSILDRWVKRMLEKADESRPVIAHSGVEPHFPELTGTDSHLELGWEHGDERELPALAAAIPSKVRFAGQFGAQSVPESADFVGADRWPDLDWERLQAHHGLDLDVMNRRVPPGMFETFDGWRRATQTYQAQLLRHHIETLRRLKYRPTGGFCLSMLADSSPMVSTSILDHLREPKLAFAAVVEACRPVIVVADRLPASLEPGTPIALDVHVISDVRRVLEQIECHAAIRWVGGSHEWRWRGDVPPDDCVRVGIIRFVVPAAPGPLWLDLSIEHGDEVATNRDYTTITPA